MNLKLNIVFILILFPFQLTANEDLIKGKEAFVADEYSNAITHFKQIAIQGNAEAQYHLGLIYESDTKHRNDELAASWYQKAAEQNHPAAQYHFGLMHTHYRGVPYDKYKASFWFHKSAELGYANAQNMLGDYYFSGVGVKKEPDKAIYWFNKAIQQGHTGAMLTLGGHYIKGERVPKDEQKGVALYRKGAEQYNDPYAQLSLAYLYKAGVGVPQNSEKALRWFNTATEQCIARAQHAMGMLYNKGELVQQDYRQAAMWFKKASNQGHYRSSVELANLYKHGLGVTKDEEKALAILDGVGERWDSKILRERIACQEDASTKLFGVVLKCTDRPSFRVAISQAGAEPINLNYKNWGDTYNTASLLKGSSELAVLYTRAGTFASAIYTFPSSMDVEQISTIKEIISNKYGEPSSSQGTMSVGEVAFKWIMQDGVEIQVIRGWPDTTTSLRYKYPENHRIWAQEIEQQRKSRLKEEYEAQSDAF